MQPSNFSRPNGHTTLVRVRQEGSGAYVAEVAGLPEMHATAASADEAIAQVGEQLAHWLQSGQLVTLTLPAIPPRKKATGWAKDDQLEQEFLADLARLRQEDLERTLREDGQEDAGCSSTSSTPTT